MICVSIGRSRHSAMIQGFRQLVQQGAELVELRVDWIQRRPDIGRLLRERPVPVVITCRRLQDKGKWFGTEEQRQAVLREAILAEADYVDIEEDIAASIPRYGRSKRIVSYHNFDETPADLEAIHQRMTACDPDIVKIVTTACSAADNFRMLQLVRNATVPTVGFCMGETGTISRLLCGRYGAPFTYAAADRTGHTAPGQLSFADMKDLYRYDNVTEATRLFGVIGDPIGHSLSPLLHNTAFKQIDFDGLYLPIRIPVGNVPEVLRTYQELGLEGVSVTIPHKHAALEFADVPDDQSQKIGAANTLVHKDGIWHATNTDFTAIIETLKSALAAANRSEDLAGKKVMILGAGGVARAAVAAMVQEKTEVLISNRSADRATALAAEFGCGTIPWDSRGSVECSILINGTSVGMHPGVQETPFDEQWLRSEMLVFDTVYVPENTRLLQEARAVGCPTAGGMEMFVRQAAVQFQLFTGHDPGISEMTATLRQALQERTPGA
ncbi:MAG: shikimate dehydrogenase [Planctomycetaceae bacterium]|nr:shikimate dehydrogenase [Planctomycetaceae bacterium]